MKQLGNEAIRPAGSQLTSSSKSKYKMDTIIKFKGTMTGTIGIHDQGQLVVHGILQNGLMFLPLSEEVNREVIVGLLFTKFGSDSAYTLMTAQEMPSI